MPLLQGIGIVVLAVLLGGLAALRRGQTSRFMPAIRTFAVVAAASVALLHLLPEAIAARGPLVLVATALGLMGPALLERMFPIRGGHAHRAPTTALAIGYAAVIAHQLGDGAAIATLARTGQLAMSIVLAIAAHTVPLAMVVAIGVIEARTHASRDAKWPTLLALTGVALATVAGALASSLVGADRVAVVEPWALASVAGLLLHALAHDALPQAMTSPQVRIAEAGSGLAGLALATTGIEDSRWLREISWPLRAAGLAAAAMIVIARSFTSRRAHHDHD